MNDDDNRLTTLMNRATATMPTSPHLATAALARGKQLRRRRLGIQVASTVAVGALAVTIGAAVLPSSPRGAAPQRAGSGPSVGQRQSTYGQGTTSPSTPKNPAAKHDPTQADVLRTFTSLVPAGVTITKRDGSTLPGTVGVVVTYDDGHGAVQMDVSLDYPPHGGGIGEACQISTCTHPEPGQTLAVYDGSDRPGRPELQPHEIEVSLQYEDSYTVNVTEWNGMQEKTPRSVTRDTPPLTIAQLQAIVSSPTWRD